MREVHETTDWLCAAALNASATVRHKFETFLWDRRVTYNAGHGTAPLLGWRVNKRVIFDSVDWVRTGRVFAEPIMRCAVDFRPVFVRAHEIASDWSTRRAEAAASVVRAFAEEDVDGILRAVGRHSVVNVVPADGVHEVQQVVFSFGLRIVWR